MKEIIITALLWGMMLIGLLYGAIATVETHPFYQEANLTEAVLTETRGMDSNSMM